MVASTDNKSGRDQAGAGSAMGQRRSQRLWSEEEDARLLRAADSVPGGAPDWLEVAKEFPGRTSLQCSQRYLRFLQPVREGRKLPVPRKWSEEEIFRLLDLVGERGADWESMEAEFDKRTAYDIKSRFYSLRRSRKLGVQSRLEGREFAAKISKAERALRSSEGWNRPGFRGSAKNSPRKPAKTGSPQSSAQLSRLPEPAESAPARTEPSGPQKAFELPSLQEHSYFYTLFHPLERSSFQPVSAPVPTSLSTPPPRAAYTPIPSPPFTSIGQLGACVFATPAGHTPLDPTPSPFGPAAPSIERLHGVSPDGPMAPVAWCPHEPGGFSGSEPCSLAGLQPFPPAPFGTGYV